MLYNIMDAEYPWSPSYFAVVVLVMNFWILNLFVAVISEADSMSEGERCVQDRTDTQGDVDLSTEER